LQLTLPKAKVGYKYEIVEIRCQGMIKRRLLDMGLVPGEVLKVIGIAPLGDPIHIQVKGYDLSLRLSEASKIVVREIGK